MRRVAQLPRAPRRQRRLQEALRVRHGRSRGAASRCVELPSVGSPVVLLPRRVSIKFSAASAASRPAGCCSATLRPRCSNPLLVYAYFRLATSVPSFWGEASRPAPRLRCPADASLVSFGVNSHLAKRASSSSAHAPRPARRQPPPASGPHLHKAPRAGCRAWPGI